MRLLIVEDNERMATLVADGLQGCGFACDIALGLGDAEDAMNVASYDAIILDLGLPDGDGIDWLARNRRYRQMPPTLVLTARGGLEDRITGLDAGADDYVVKPIELDELAARIRALLRRPGARAQPVIEVGRLRFDVAGRVASFDDRPIDLSRREADLLELLMRHAGTVVHRDVIANALYSFNGAVTPNAVEAAISRVRRKLEEVRVTGQLHTVRGVGYMLKDSAP